MRVTHVDSQCVVSSEGCTQNLNSSLARGLPLCSPLPERIGHLAIVGSGPSVREHIDELREWPGDIWTINGAYHYLLGHNIVADGFIGVDPLPGLAEYVEHSHPETTFYISGLCDPAVFDALRVRDVRTWFPEQDTVKFPGGIWLVGGGTTAVTRAPLLAKMLGWRDITIFGADCSFEESRYCYEHGTFREDSKAPINWVVVNKEGPFPTELGLLKQASQLAVIQQGFNGRLSFKCGGLLDAYLRAPMMDESLIDAMRNHETANSDAA